MKKILAIQVIDVLAKNAARSKSKKIDIANAQTIKAAFNAFIQLGTDIYGYPFATNIANEGITTPTAFSMLLMSDEFKNMLKADFIGAGLIKQIKYPSAKRIAEEMQTIHNTYKNSIIADAADVDDAEHTYAIRTKFGNGPVVFVKGVKTDNGRHDVRKWYAWAHGINYFEVRECSFEHWANNPDTQIATNL